MDQNPPKGLVMLWVTQDKEAAQNMIFMYARNSKIRGWWERVRIVVWGPSASLLASDEELQGELVELKSVGVELSACKACSDMYGVSEKLAELGIEVIHVGLPLTDNIKEGWAVITI
jgi:hypothetical protein